LHLSQLLFEALGIVTQERISYVYNAIDAAFHQYPPNTFSSTDFLGIDNLAKDIGVDVKGADHALKAYIHKGLSGSDVGIWSYLPSAYAIALLNSRVWAEADFRPFLEAHSNDVNVMAVCISEIIAASKSITSIGTTDLKEISSTLLSFIEMTAVLVMRAVRNNNVNGTVKSKLAVASTAVFLDQFAQSTPHITGDQLEPLLPTAFLRFCYRDLYDMVSKDGEA